MYAKSQSFMRKLSSETIFFLFTSAQKPHRSRHLKLNASSFLSTLCSIIKDWRLIIKNVIVSTFAASFPPQYLAKKFKQSVSFSTFEICPITYKKSPTYYPFKNVTNVSSSMSCNTTLRNFPLYYSTLL